jgi:Glycoside hydrolase 123, catalytic domain/Glycoside hydrolase 123 N-terminal domain
MGERVRRALAIGACVFVSSVPAARADLREPRIEAGRLAHPPAIDGRVEEGEWTGAARLASFPVWTLRTYAEEPLQVRLGYDERSFYFAFRCSVPDRGALDGLPARGARDSFLWGRPYVRLVLRSGATSVWIMLDPRGTLADARGEDQGWNGRWAYETRIDDSGWSAEGRIAFADLGLAVPAAGETWQVEAQDSAVGWSGTLVFAGDRALLCVPDPWPAPRPGQNRLTVRLSRGGGSPRAVVAEIELLPFEGEPRYVDQEGQGPASHLQLSVRRPPSTFRRTIRLDAPGSRTESLAYELPEEGSYYATLGVEDVEGGRLLHRSRGFWFQLAPNRKTIERLSLRLGEVRADLARLPAGARSALRGERDRISAELDGCRQDLAPAWAGRRWDGLADRLAALESRIDRYQHHVRNVSLRGEASVGSEFGVSAVSSLVKLPRDAALPVPLQAEVALSAARNERESFQVAILPFGEELRDVRVEATALAGPGQATIPRESIETSLVEYVKIDWDSDYETDRRGWWPDPLVPLRGPFLVPGGVTCQPVWVTVHVPPGTPAGDYRGTITVRPADAEAQTLAVKLHVWDFELPREGHLKTHTWDAVEPFARFYNLDAYPVEWYLRLSDLLLKNRLNPGFAGVNYAPRSPAPDGSYDFRTTEKVLRHCLDRGLTRFSILQMRKGRYAPEEAAQVYAFVKAYADFLREKGWLDKALVELWDEPLLHEWPDVKARAEKIHEIAPGLKVQLFANLGEGPYAFWTEEARRLGTDRLIDIWAPIPPIEAPDLQARGGEVWTYFCTLARGTAPNLYIDRPAVYQRTIGWHSFMYNVDGFEHWSVNSFERNVHPGWPLFEKWPHVPWDARSIGAFSGEGQLVYPGEGGEPWPSLRLEVFRDSMEDYEYLYRLRELAGHAGPRVDAAELGRIRQWLAPEQYLLLKYPREVRTTLEGTIRYPDQPERFLEARAAIAEAIERLQAVAASGR